MFCGKQLFSFVALIVLFSSVTAVASTPAEILNSNIEFLELPANAKIALIRAHNKQFGLGLAQREFTVGHVVRTSSLYFAAVIGSRRVIAEIKSSLNKKNLRLGMVQIEIDEYLKNGETPPLFQNSRIENLPLTHSDLVQLNNSCIKTIDQFFGLTTQELLKNHFDSHTGIFFRTKFRYYDLFENYGHILFDDVVHRAQFSRTHLSANTSLDGVRMSTECRRYSKSLGLNTVGDVKNLHDNFLQNSSSFLPKKEKTEIEFLELRRVLNALIQTSCEANLLPNY